MTRVVVVLPGAVRTGQREAGIVRRIRLGLGRQALGGKSIGKRIGQCAVGGQHALRIGFGARNECAGGAAMRTRDTADGVQFGQGRKRRLTVGRAARGGRRIAGLGDEHPEPHGRIPQRTIALVIGRMPVERGCLGDCNRRAYCCAECVASGQKSAVGACRCGGRESVRRVFPQTNPASGARPETCCRTLDDGGRFTARHRVPQPVPGATRALLSTCGCGMSRAQRPVA